MVQFDLIDTGGMMDGSESVFRGPLDDLMDAGGRPDGFEGCRRASE